MQFSSSSSPWFWNVQTWGLHCNLHCNVIALQIGLLTSSQGFQSCHTLSDLSWSLKHWIKTVRIFHNYKNRTLEKKHLGSAAILRCSLVSVDYGCATSSSSLCWLWVHTFLDHCFWGSRILSAAFSLHTLYFQINLQFYKMKSLMRRVSLWVSSYFLNAEQGVSF